MNGSVVLPLHEQSFPYLKTAGVLLREAREVKGLSQEDAASALNLMTSHIAALESDSYNPQLEGKHFGSYLKSYAKFLDLNPQILLGLYQTQLKQPVQNSATYSTALEPAPRSGLSLRVALVCLLMIVAWTFDRGDLESLRDIVAGKDLRLFKAEEHAANGTDSKTAASDETTWTTPEWADQAEGAETEGADIVQPQQATAAVTTLVLPSASDQTINAQRTSVVVTPSDSKYQAYRLDVSEDYGATASAVLVSGVTDDILLFNFHDNCWVEVYDRHQNPIVMDTKLQGETLRITGEAPFEVRVGNSRAVSLSLNGQPILIEQHPTIDSTELIVGRR
ncbi:MAG: helix-turn-helix domain-containing protein [Pseudomonadales bacterium]